MKRYLNISTDKIEGKQAYRTTQYPEIPLSETDLYLYATVGDRYDTLALQFYDDATFWWVIAAANPNNGLDSIVPPPGVQLRVPQNPFDVLALFNRQNAR
jgi:hypothetical protein